MKKYLKVYKQSCNYERFSNVISDAQGVLCEVVEAIEEKNNTEKQNNRARDFAVDNIVQMYVNSCT